MKKILFTCFGIIALATGCSEVASDEKSKAGADVKVITVSKSQNELVPFKSANGKYGYKDIDGTIVVPAENYRTHPFSEGLGRVHKKRTDDYSMYNFVDRNGKEAFKYDYYNVGDFHEGLAWAGSEVSSTDGSSYWYYKFIDKSGEIVIDTKFDKVSDFKNGYATVSKDNESFEIDRNGNRISKAKRLTLERSTTASTCINIASVGFSTSYIVENPVTLNLNGPENILVDLVSNNSATLSSFGGDCVNGQYNYAFTVNSGLTQKVQKIYRGAFLFPKNVKYCDIEVSENQSTMSCN